MPKRKIKNFYAVAIGRNVGIYRTWPECQKQVSGYKGAVYKGFATREQCAEYIRENGPNDDWQDPQEISSSTMDPNTVTDGSTELGKGLLPYTQFYC